jgi:hypothetical protein
VCAHLVCVRGQRRVAIGVWIEWLVARGGNALGGMSGFLYWSPATYSLRLNG